MTRRSDKLECRSISLWGPGKPRGDGSEFTPPRWTRPPRRGSQSPFVPPPQYARRASRKSVGPGASSAQHSSSAMNGPATGFSRRGRDIRPQAKSASGIAARKGRDASAARRGTRKSPTASGGDARPSHSLTRILCYSNSNVRLPQPLSQPHPPHPNVQLPQPPPCPSMPRQPPVHRHPLTPPASAATALPDD